MSFKNLAYHIEIEVEYLEKTVVSGYRPQFFYNGHDWDGQHYYNDEVKPGRKTRGFISLMSPNLHKGKLWAGQPFLLKEGSKIVGFGVVKRINFDGLLL